MFTERYLQLLELCLGGKRVYPLCVPGCGALHREFFAFSSIGGFAAFCNVTRHVLTTMNEPQILTFLDPECKTADLYKLIVNSQLILPTIIFFVNRVLSS